MSEEALDRHSLKKILSDPESNANVENILDVIAALVWDCNFQSAKNSKAIQSFVNRFSDLADAIYSQRTKYSDFELVKVIGQGGFGRVQLVRHKDTRRVYAMKMMSKQHLLDHSQSGYWEERDIMVKATSEWLVTCHQAFVDKDNIYLCMEYMPGGDLYYWLEYYDTFSEEQARFYLAETVLALEALHSLGYIHRDLKPDNMLLDAKGHLKLADFGSCVRLDSQGRYFCASPIGTPDYISPEMLNCQSKAGFIGPACDWWAMGVIAFEMLFGETAFYGQSLVETYSRILAHEKSLVFPTDTEITPNFESLIRALLQGPAVRLGAQRGASEVKEHPFFEALEWSSLRSATPPIQPVVNSEVDTSNINFDEAEIISGDGKFGRSGECGSSNSSGGSPSNLPRSVGAFAAKKPAGPPAYFTGENLAFAGFTFDRDERQKQKDVSLPGGCSGEECREENNQSEVEATLAEFRAQLTSVEKQAAIDKIAAIEAQSRLNDIRMELETSKTELERFLDESKTQSSAFQTERDALIDRVNRLQAELLTATDDLENERKVLASIKEEIANAKVQQPPIQPPMVLEDKQQNVQVVNEELQEEFRQRASRAEAELANNLRVHLEEMADISDQLQTAKSFSQLYKSQLAEAEEMAAAAHKNVAVFTTELNGLRATLDSTQVARKELKEKVFNLDSDLALAKFELDGARKTLETEMKNSQAQINRLKERLSAQASTITTMTAQRQDLLQHCKALEDNVSTLTTQTQVLRRENEIQKLKIDQTVTKLIEVAQVAPGTGKTKKKNAEAAKVASLEKQLRNLEHKRQKEVADLQSTLSRLKTDNEEKAKAMAELTDSNKALLMDLEKTHTELGFQNLRLSGKHQGSDMSINSSPTGTLKEVNAMDPVRADISLSMESLMLIGGSGNTLEGICDFPEKIRGKKKLAWTPKFVVISPRFISFFASKEQREQYAAVATEEIPMQKIFSIRPGTILDLTYASKEDATRLICIISDEMTPDSNGNGASRDLDRISLMSGAGNTSTLNATLNPNTSSSVGNSNLISWQGHSFQPMTFRIMNTICEVCGGSCSDLRSPPPALECVRCRMRIHRTHVENHQKFVVCPKTVRQWIIRAPSPADRNAWITRINQLKQEVAYEHGLSSPTNRYISMTPTSSSFNNTLRYRSMRNFGAFKDIATRRSIAVTFPRQSTALSLSNATTTATVPQSPPASSTHQHTHAPNPESQHDI